MFPNIKTQKGTIRYNQFLNWLCEYNKNNKTKIVFLEDFFNGKCNELSFVEYYNTLVYDNLIVQSFDSLPYTFQKGIFEKYFSDMSCEIKIEKAKCSIFSNTENFYISYPTFKCCVDYYFK